MNGIFILIKWKSVFYNDTSIFDNYIKISSFLIIRYIHNSVILKNGF